MNSRLNKIKRRLVYNALPKKTIEYIACPMINLGDQALLEAIDQTFPDVVLNHPIGGRSVLSNLVKKWERRQMRLASMLGGGTLIGPGNWGAARCDLFESSLNQMQRGIVFGTGAADLSFPSYQHDYKLNPAAYHRWTNVLNRCEYIGVRGPGTQKTLQELGVESEVIGDPACFLVQQQGFWKPIPGHLGINIGYGHGIWGDEPDFFSRMTKFLSKATKQGWKIEFFVVVDADRLLSQKLAADAGIHNPVIHCQYRNANNYLIQVRRMQAFIGMKLHAVIFAMCALVPSIMLEYRPKCRDFMSSMGMEGFNIRTSEVDESSLFALLGDLLSRETAISEDIERKMVEFKKIQQARAGQFLSKSNTEGCL